MRSMNLLRWAGALVLAVSLSSERAVAQDTLSIAGMFQMNALYPTVGADLAGVQPNAADRWWRLTLQGVSYSYYYEFYYDEWVGEYLNYYYTRVYATSFTLEFFGPGAATLNQAVSAQLAGGSLTDGAVLEFLNGEYVNYDFYNGVEPYASWQLGLAPSDPSTGVSFASYDNLYGHFPTDAQGYPVAPLQRFEYVSSQIVDRRAGNDGWLESNQDIVDIGSDQQPILPPPQIDIWDASKLEGDKGATTLLMTVTLNRASSQVVTMSYQTADGTALVSNKDYVKKSGTLTFQPGETSKTIAVTITGDHKRERNETFTVRLSNAIGGNLGRSVGTATILNDD